jgi:hypothetical protein
MGPLAAIGIVKGKPFAPDARRKKILTEALALANATSRSLLMNPRDPEYYYYPDSAWWNSLFVSGYEFETPIPAVTPEGVKPFPPTGYRTLNARTLFFYGVTGITPAMAMRVPGIGSQYLFATVDANKQYFDGAKTYKVTLPKDIPEANFWSFTLYDNQTRSMLDTPQRYPRAGSQSYPTPAAEASADGSTTVYFAPTKPEGVNEGNWIQTAEVTHLTRDKPATVTTVTFKATKITFNGDAPATVPGEITILGVTKPATLTVTHFTCGTHPMLKKDLCGAEATTTIKRSEFGMTKYVPAVGDEVKLAIQVEAIKD